MSERDSAKDGRELEETLRAFDEALNRHGHPFQHAVVQRARDAVKARMSTFVLQATEFPVSVQGVSTHIDIVFKNEHQRIYLICECKRVNPAYGAWSFARSPFVHATRMDSTGDGRHSDPAIIEALQLRNAPLGEMRNYDVRSVAVLL